MLFRSQDLARVEALLGHASEARAAMQQAFTSLPPAGDAGTEAELRLTHAVVLCWTGDKEGALQELAWSLQHPFGANVHVADKVSWFAPLHGDPRFEALLNDPKNNAPLF